MKNILFGLTLFIGTLLFGQTETTQFNGKTYFVYPHQSQLLEPTVSTFILFAKKKEVLKRDEKNRNVVGKTIEPVTREYEQYIKKDKSIRGLFTILGKMVKENPNDIYSFDNLLAFGLVPSLEEIPDGDYVQFYKDVPFLDKETLRFKNDIVSATFTVKNGMADGEIVFLNTQGKEIAWGNYNAGSRIGIWKTLIVKSEYGRGATFNVKSYDDLLSKKSIDTLSEMISYSNGLKNGAYLKMINKDTISNGSYLNDAEAGTWKKWQYKIVQLNKETYDFTTQIIPESVYTIAEKPKPGKSIILREEFMLPEFAELNYDYDETGKAKNEQKFVFPDQGLFYQGYLAFSEFYTINREEEENFEMPEEDLNSFEGEEYDIDYYDRYYGRNETDKNKLIDSLGYIFNYTGVYEKYYPNGQLQFRFEVVDGVLQKEEPVYWDNGKVANDVVFVSDSNRYEVRYYDYEGKIYFTEHYDVKGKSLDTNDFEGFYERNDYGMEPPGYEALNLLEIDINPEKLKGELKEKRTLVEKKWNFNQNQAFLKTYDPAEKKLEVTVTALSGNVVNKDEITFSEDFTSVNGYEEYYLGKLKLHRQLNGSRSEENYFMELFGAEDSTLTNEEKYVENWYYRFDTDYDDVLYFDNQPFTGKYEIKLDEKSYKMKAGNASISFSVPANERKMLSKAGQKYWKKNKKSDLLDFVNSEVRGEMVIIRSTVMQFTRFAEYNVLAMSGDDDYWEGEFEAGRVPSMKTVSGMMLNGKPNGIWTGRDQNGKVIVELGFLNGEENGELKVYKTEFARTKKQQKLEELYGFDYYGGGYKTEKPLKDTKYLSETASFKNGMLNGPRLTYNWKGDTLSYAFYRDGSMEGNAFEKNSYVKVYSNYENDALDGVLRTWLTMPGKSPVLLYDLNFQNGMLQGESKTYHSNGKLAKRGFFLTGQPIDDYEAFDSLGFKYQYVKFKYNQPVEEKIWEENELSLRYEFDWRDSIPFNVRDIAKSPSVEELMLELGMAGDEYYEPYLGRPSLVDKTGIDYYMTKYYPNDTIAREGFISKGKKSACWKYYGYDGKLLYEVDYMDTVIRLNDSIKFKSKGIQSFLDAKGNAVSHSYIIEKFEKYDCSHTDHYEERMLYCFWEKDSSTHRRNGYVVNYYDNGAKMNEGTVVNGLPEGVWKMYDNSGNLNKVGEYKLGKRQGRWLTGDLTNVKFLGDICLNPNLPNLDEIMKYQEKLIDITVIYYNNGKSLRKEYYGINMNSGDAPGGGYGDYYGE